MGVSVFYLSVLMVILFLLTCISGGGAGGSVWIVCEEIIGHGWITANGGNGGGTTAVAGGGGSGGRISIVADNVNKLNITLEAHGGKFFEYGIC